VASKPQIRFKANNAFSEPMLGLTQSRKDAKFFLYLDMFSLRLGAFA
jgi:hypothetical protein